MHGEFDLNLDWTHFTPWSALAGGALIGVAATVFLLGSGRIAGIAGIVGQPLADLLRGRGLSGHGGRITFLAGMLAAPWLWRAFAELPPMTVQTSTGGLILAGVLVGIGTRMGNGCTSGHGVCGLSRGSMRSLANVLAFMGAGFVTVFVLRHVLG